MLTLRRVSTWHPLMVEQIRLHYTGSNGAPPGKKLAWIAEFNAEPFAVLGLGEPAFKLAPRRRLGLVDARPLPFTVSNFIYRKFSDVPVRGEELLNLWHATAAADWLNQYGWTPVHWETLVLPSAIKSGVAGACYRRVGYRSCGLTTGRTARRPPGHTHTARVWSDSEPKLLLYRGPLQRVPT